MLISFVRTVRIEAFTAYLPLKLVSEIICLNSKGQLTRGPMAFPSLPHHQPLRCSVLLNRRAEIAPVLTHRRYIGTGPVLNGPIRIGWPQNNIRWQLSSTPESDLTWLQSKKFTGQMGGPCQLSKLRVTKSRSLARNCPYKFWIFVILSSNFHFAQLCT